MKNREVRSRRLCRGLELLGLLILVGALFLPITPAHAQSQTSPLYSLGVGAWGDTSSIGSTAVRVQIQTNTYNVGHDNDAFWVGDDLENGAIIQFGYIIHPGHVCLQGTIQGSVDQFGTPSFYPGWYPGLYLGTAGLDGPLIHCAGSMENIGSDDVRWFWEYSPHVNFSCCIAFITDVYFEFGPANSAGMNGTWHDYSIEPNSTNYWSFMLDGRQVATLPFSVSNSALPPYVVAEKVTESPLPGRLGPTEFRNLQYLNDGSWTGVSYLIADSFPWNSPGPYGVAGNANVLIAGSGIPQPSFNSIIWGEGAVVTIVGVGCGGLSYPCNLLDTLDTFPQLHVDTFPFTFGGNEPVMTTVSFPGKTRFGVAFLSSEGVQFVVRNGSTIALPQTIPLYGSITFTNGTTVRYAKVRIEFEGWSDGYPSPNRTFTLNSNVRLNATYVEQYRLDIFSPNSSRGCIMRTGPYGPIIKPEESEIVVGWYNAGSTIVPPVPNTTPVQGVWGTLGAVYHFRGLYRNPCYVLSPLTSSTNATLVMNRPYTLYVKWSEPDYTVPIIVTAAIVAIALVSFDLYLRRRNEGRSKRPRRVVTLPPRKGGAGA